MSLVHDDILATLCQRKAEGLLAEEWEGMLNCEKLERVLSKIANDESEFVSFFTKMYKTQYSSSVASEDFASLLLLDRKNLEKYANAQTLWPQVMAAQLLLKYRGRETVIPATSGELFGLLAEEHPSPEYAQLVIDEILANNHLIKQFIERDLLPDLCSLLRRNFGLSESEEAQARICPIGTHMWQAYDFAHRVEPQKDRSVGTPVEQFAQNVINLYHKLTEMGD